MRVGSLVLAILLLAPGAALAQGDPSDEAPDALAPPAPLTDDGAGDPADRATTSTDPRGDAPPAPGDIPRDPSDEQAPAGAGAVDIERVAGPSVVRVRARLLDGRVRHASGVFVGPREVVTTYTALREADSGEVDLGGDPRPFTIDGVVAVDEARDLAVVLLAERDVGSRPIALAEAPPAEGDRVWTLAFPQHHTSSRPVLVAGRAQTPSRRGTLLSDHTPERGTPGGALVDARGELVGVLLPGEGPGGAARAADVDDLRDLLSRRHQPVRLLNLERFLNEEAEGEVYGEAYVDDGYAADDNGYSDLEDDGGAATRRRRSSRDRRSSGGSRSSSSSSRDVACVLAGCFVGPPVAMGAGLVAAGFSVCAIYGCAAVFVVLTTIARIGVVMASVGAGLALIAGVVAAGALLVTAAPALAPGVAGPGALAVAGGAGVVAIAGGSLVAGGAALARAWSDPPEEGSAEAPERAEVPPAAGAPRQGLREAY